MSYVEDEAPIFQVAPVTRAGMKMLISLYGMSETGKTYSALMLACGIEPDPKKRGLLDTEGGERGRMYVDDVPGGFMYGAMGPPFTPERYMQALMLFVKAGVTTLVVDSVSHAWFAQGGVLEMVEQSNNKNDMAKWSAPKRRLAKLTNQWIGCGLHLILCARGKQPLIESTDDRGKKKYEYGPVVPVQEKSLRFDMTVMAKMLGDGHFTVDRAEGGKCPGALRPIFASGKVMSPEMGSQLIAWIGGQDSTTPEERAILLNAKEVAGEGRDAFVAWHASLPKEVKAMLKHHMGNLASIYRAADGEREQRERDDRAASAAGLDHPFGSPVTGPALPEGVHPAAPAEAAA